jgi:hypothetical protein
MSVPNYPKTTNTAMTTQLLQDKALDTDLIRRVLSRDKETFLFFDKLQRSRQFQPDPNAFEDFKRKLLVDCPDISESDIPKVLELLREMSDAVVTIEHYERMERRYPGLAENIKFSDYEREDIPRELRELYDEVTELSKKVTV